MATIGLHGRIAIVTGASRRIGIGAAICRALAANGADIFFTHWSAFDWTLPWGADEDDPARLQSELQGSSLDYRTSDTFKRRFSIMISKEDEL